MLLFQADRSGYDEPLQNAIEATHKAILDAGFPVEGAQARMRMALDARADLEAYQASKLGHLEREDFYALPHPKSRDGRERHYHDLTVGIWRGIFLLDPGGERVIGILFSRAPHDLVPNLSQLVKPRDPLTIPDDG